LGPPGAGKSWQANELANKYRLVDVDCRLLLKQGLSSDNALAKQMLPFYERDIPSKHI
jgi:adenylate kinase family enzyme